MHCTKRRSTWRADGRPRASLTILYAIVVFDMAAATGAAAQTVINTDKLIYEYGQNVSVVFQAPPPRFENDDRIFGFVLNDTPNLLSPIPCGEALPGGGGECLISTTEILSPDQVTRRARAYIYNTQIERPAPGRERIVYIRRPVEPAPGAMTLPNGRVYRPWDDIAVRIAGIDQFFEAYDGGYLNIRRVGRVVEGGAHSPPTGVHNLNAETLLMAGVESYVRTAHYDETGQTEIFQLGFYEMLLVGGDDNFILARAPFEVRLPDFSDVLKFANPLLDDENYDSERRPQIYVDLPEALMGARNYLTLAFVRLGPDGVPQLAYSESLQENLSGTPTRAELGAPAPLTANAAVSPLFVQNSGDPLKPGRYQARLYFNMSTLPRERLYWLAESIILDTLDFTIAGTLGPAYQPDPARREIAFGDVTLELDAERYSIGDTAEARIIPDAGVDLSGETLWLGVHRVAWATFGCRLTEEMLVGASPIFPGAGDFAAWDRTSSVYGTYAAARDPRLLVPSAPALPGLPSLPTLPSLPSLPGLPSFGGDTGPALALSELPPLVETDPQVNDLPGTSFGGGAFGEVLVRVGADERNAELDLAVYPGRYEVRLYRGRRSPSQPGPAVEGDRLPDAELLARTAFIVEARTEDLQISLLSPQTINVDYSAHNYVTRQLPGGGIETRTSYEEPPFDVEVMLSGDGVARLGPKLFLVWLGDKGAGGAVQPGSLEPIAEAVALGGGRFRFTARGIDGGQYLVQVRDALNDIVFGETAAFTLRYDNYVTEEGNRLTWPAEMAIATPLRSEYLPAPVSLNIWAPDCVEPLIADAIPEIRIAEWRPSEVLEEPPLLDEDELSTPIPEGEFVIVENVFYGHPFFIEAAFEESQPGEAYTVTVDGNINVEVRRTEENPLLYRSRAVVLTHEPSRGETPR